MDSEKRISQRLLDRREFVKDMAKGAAAISLAGIAPGVSFSSSTKELATGKQPNVLFIFFDQFRADACGVYGAKDIQTPNIDRLASQGSHFTNALSTCPLCTPYRGMLMTGRYPTHSGLVINELAPNPNQRCLAHVFRDAGYKTGFIGKWHLAPGWCSRGGIYSLDERAHQEYLKINPEEAFVPPGPQRLGYEHWEAYNYHDDFNHSFYYRDEPVKEYLPGFETDGQMDLAIRFMEKNKDSKQPFFLTVAPHPPHPPFAPKNSPAGYLEQIPNELHWAPNIPVDHPRHKDSLEVRCYLAMCKNLDDNIGRIMKYLDKAGLAENTIVVLTSDHGEMHGAHGRIQKMLPYAESVNIPLIMRWPKNIPTGVTSDVLHTPMDHMATLCGLCGLNMPNTCDGMDLSPVVLGRKKVNRDAVLIMHYSSHYDYFQTSLGLTNAMVNCLEWRGVRTEQFTYCKYINGLEELYDNAADPYQLNNLAALGQQRDLPRLKLMRSRMKDLMAEAHDEFLLGNAYGEWYDDHRNLIRTALGAV
jgi:arylsulfatase A-like enzyme